MKIFPTKNEQLITVTILSFLIGSLVGVFSSSLISDKSLFLPAIATLAAAFIGAWAAYKLQDNKNKRDCEALCISNANNVLFALYERIKALKVVQHQLINPQRDLPFKMISMLPTLNLSYPDSEFNIESLMFMLETKHKQLILDLQTEKECFKVAFNVIKFRSEIHFHHVQPAMESGGIQEGGEYTRQELINAIGERIFSQLERATDDLIENVDKSVESGEKIKVRLVKALKELFPNKTIMNFEINEVQETA